MHTANQLRRIFSISNAGICNTPHKSWQEKFFAFFCNKAQGHFDYYSDGVKEEIRLQVIDWQKIIKKHGPSVWKTAYRLLGDCTDAADCFQETFICALEVSRRQHVRNFSALLARLATSRAIDRLRRALHKRHKTTNWLRGYENR